MERLEWNKSKEGNCEQPKEVVMLRAIAIYNIGDSGQGDSERQRCESHREDGTGVTCDGMYASSYVLNRPRLPSPSHRRHHRHVHKVDSNIDSKIRQTYTYGQ